MKRPAPIDFLRIVAAAFLCLAFGACASFDPRWRAASTSKTATRWDGRWTSAKHHTFNGGPEGGRLRCVLEPAGNGRLDAHFHANFLCFSGNYSVVLQPKPKAAKSEFLGTQEMPQVFGGTYWYTAQITKDHFAARYDSEYDNGTFELRRVKSSADFNSPHAGD